MAKKDVLFLDACVRGPRSRTLQLANRFLERLPNAEIRRVRLDTLGLLPLDRERLLTRDRLLREGKTDDAFFDLAKEFRRAQWLVVAAPYWETSGDSLQSSREAFTSLAVISSPLWNKTPCFKWNTHSVSLVFS